ncbi:hypothetical protein B0H67DRAFT_681057 [Lasiosphaeris hirsuta]|uniref:Uncharacterized protein n=1 Tax=Lasiosphaeris hirsuta TaxID=260670 RepID=A0AA40E2Q2_9PEZI|nr:hypothetical protein B0H67DRAFT_681057 [Lasiosphaeris hirsuta]
MRINAWQSADNRVVVSFGLAAPGIVKKRIIFFTGVKIRPGLFDIRTEHEERWRGDSDEVFLVDNADDDGLRAAYKAGLEMLGDDWYLIDEPEGEPLSLDEDVGRHSLRLLT